jgi:N-acetylneuraminate synthase
MQVDIGGRLVGDGQPCYVIGEVGINHNGCVDTACSLIEVASNAGAEAVKFQKRSVDDVYSEEELARPRESIYGTTNGDLKRGLELGAEDYRQIGEYAAYHSLQWFASCWDCGSVDFMEQFNPPAYKIASASVTDLELIGYTASTGKPILLSTGMSRLDQIDAAVDLITSRGNPLVVLHCVSTYPSENQHLNLRCIPMLRQRYAVPIGYSGHEHGIATSVAAVAMGACIVERHITLDRAMWGSDQAASLEPAGFTRLVRDIRAVEAAMGSGQKSVLPEEEAISAKLRKVG